MWKITTRGFTLEEVLIMAVMNLLTSVDTVTKHEKRAFAEVTRRRSMELKYSIQRAAVIVGFAELSC